MARILSILMWVVSVPSLDGERYKRVCYLESDSLKRLNPRGRFLLTDDAIDPLLCTHLIYSSAEIDTDSFNLRPNVDDLSTKDRMGNYEKFNGIKLKNSNLRTLISIGETEFGGSHFKTILDDSESRSKFSRNVVSFLRKFTFDGLDLYWRHINSADQKSPILKHKFTILIQELMKQFEYESNQRQTERLLLSAAVSASNGTINELYEIEEISRTLDFVTVLTFDFHGPWQVRTGHNSPLHPVKGNLFQRHLNIEWAINRWIGGGAPAEKLVMAVAAQGRSFTLASHKVNKMAARSTGPGIHGPFIQELGVMSYFEICKLINDGATRVWDDEQKVPYAYRDRLWIGFDDPVSIQAKTHWAVKNGLGGVMIWSLDLDDYSGEYCHLGRYPLTRAMATILSTEEEKYWERRVEEENRDITSEQTMPGPKAEHEDYIAEDILTREDEILEPDSSSTHAITNPPVFTLASTLLIFLMTRC